MKKVIITGATSGIGRELAIQFAQKDFRVLLVGKNLKKLKILKETIGEKASFICVDLNDILEVKKITEDADILINCAGIAEMGLNLDAKKSEEIINVNIQALVILTQIYAKKFLENGKGIIVNIASTSAFYPNPNLAVYSASKSFVLNYTLSLNEEMKRLNKNVVVKVMCPGPTKTNIFQPKVKNKISKFECFEMNPSYVAEKIIKNINSKRKKYVIGKFTYFFKMIPLSLRNKILYIFMKVGE